MAWKFQTDVDDLRLVSASAGSGKTHTLMQVVSELVSSKKEDPGCILMTTFTDKAADELKQRMRKTLLASDAPDASEKAARAESGLIGTVNGVAGRILSDYAMDAGLAPQLQVLPEASQRTIFNRAVAGVMAARESEVEPLACRLGFQAVKRHSHDMSADWRSVVRDIVDRARANGISDLQLEESKHWSVQTAGTWFDGSLPLTLEDVALRLKPMESELDREDFTVAGRKYCDKAKEFLKFKNWPNALELAVGELGRGDDTPLKDFRNALNGELLHASALRADVLKMIELVFDMAAQGMEAYKRFKDRYGLIDFTDQEAELLRLLRQETFGNRLAERVHRVLVDEFQDTSPIQLALFSRLGAIAGGKMIWVGDPKQSIYGFRGSDPALMAKAAASIPDANREHLRFSWRSRERLVGFSNAVFERAFAGVAGCDGSVHLDVPDARQPEAAGGTIEAWMLSAGKAGDRMGQIADGIAQLHEEGTPYGDIAVLLKKGTDCQGMVAALSARGIPVASGGGRLFETDEVRLAMAAYRYAADPHDTIALATLAAHVMDPDGWLTALAADPGESLRKWAEKAKIAEGVGTPALLTPLELLDRVIVHFKIDSQSRKRGEGSRRIGNLEALRAKCAEYMAACALEGTPATHAGFIAQSRDDKSEEAMAPGGDSVTVLTYHKAKGLEWPTVILGTLAYDAKRTPFDLEVVAPPAFDAVDPLAGRKLCWVPCPFGTLGSDAKRDWMCRNASFAAALERIGLDEREELKRLMYVGVTRAKSRLVFAPQLKLLANGRARVHAEWLDALTPTSLFGDNWKTTSGRASWSIGESSFDVETKVFSDVREIAKPVHARTPAAIEIPAPRLAAKVAPSSREGEQVAVQAGECRALGGRMPVAPGKCSSELGECFHGYMAVAMVSGESLELARNLVARWGVSGAVAPEDLVKAGSRLRTELARQWPGCAVEAEVPMSYVNEAGQVSEGFMDLLVRVGEKEYVLVDHKVVEDGAAETVVPQYAAQQEVYRRAVASVCGSVRAVYLHLPVQGKLVEIVFPKV